MDGGERIAGDLLDIPIFVFAPVHLPSPRCNLVEGSDGDALVLGLVVGGALSIPWHVWKRHGPSRKQQH